MSRVVSCDGGCGTTDQPGALTRLERVSVTLGTEKARMGRRTFEADLCPVCASGLLRGYFGVRQPEDPYELAPFLRGAA